MGYDGDASENHPDNQKCQHEGWSDIRDKRRNCTDKLCMLLILAVWAGMTFIGLIVLGAIHDSHLEPGQPQRLLSSTDYKGRICGYDSAVKDLKYGYYLADLTAICVESCPSENNFEQFLCKYDKQADADASIVDGYNSLLKFECMFKIKTKKFLNRCFPDTDVAAASSLAQATAANNGVSISAQIATYSTSASENSGWLDKFLGDVVNLSSYIGGFGLGVSTVVAFAYLYLLRIPGILTALIWGIILGIFACLLVGSLLLWSLAKSWSKDDLHSDPEVTVMRVFAWILFAVTFLYFCLIVVMRKRVNLAISIVKQAARALAAMPSLLLMPLIQTVGLTLFLVPWTIYVMYLASSGSVETRSASYEYGGQTYNYSYRSFTYTDDARKAFLYLLFSWFWTSEFIMAFGQLTVALAFTAWFFNRDKSKTGWVTVKWAFVTTFFYHTGTVAYGSLVIAVILTIRAVLAYIQRKAKKSKNKVVEYLACIVNCIMWCVEKIMRFLNKHAYTMTAIYGYSFCKAARSGFFLIVRNILRVSAVSMVSSFLLFIGKLFIPTATTFLCYLCVAYGTNSDDINGLIAPLVFVFILAYWVSSMFLEIFGMGIETILCCYIADEEMFKVEDRFVERDLVAVCMGTQKAVQGGRVAAEIVSAEQEKAAAATGESALVTKLPPPPGGVVF